MTLVIYGPGGCGREIAGISRPLCFVSDDPADVGTNVSGVEVIDFARLLELSGEQRISVVVAINDAAIRRRIYRRLEANGLKHGCLMASSCYVGTGVEIGPGAILTHQATVTADTRIGRSFHANIFASVAHDCVIGDFVTLGPRACVNGNTIIEDDAYIGAGALLRQGTRQKPLRIGRGAIVGMGAVVLNDVPPGAIVAGNPARPIYKK